MKSLKLLFFVCLLPVVATAQKQNTRYDKKLAEKLGGDEYGMKGYVLVILKTGPAKIERKATVDSLFERHMSNIGRLANEHKLIVAGPIDKNKNNYRGIFILDVRTIEEARTLADTDPAIRAHLLDTEFYQWYGSAALPEYLPFHERITNDR